MAAWRATGCGWSQPDKNVREIATELLADYPQVRFEFAIRQQMAPRAICTQYLENDFDFLRRILASEGLNWRFGHEQSDTSSTSQAKHKLVVFDGKAAAPDMPGDSALRFHGVRATDTHDAIDQFAAVRRVQPNAVTSSSWHPEQLVAPAAERTSGLMRASCPPCLCTTAAANDVTWTALQHRCTANWCCRRLSSITSSSPAQARYARWHLVTHLT
jgi:hypothetical protein